MIMCGFHESQQAGHWVLVTGDPAKVTGSEQVPIGPANEAQP
jgi:hypothetical protein